CRQAEHRSPRARWSTTPPPGRHGRLPDARLLHQPSLSSEMLRAGRRTLGELDAEGATQRPRLGLDGSLQRRSASACCGRMGTCVAAVHPVRSDARPATTHLPPTLVGSGADVYRGPPPAIAAALCRAAMTCTDAPAIRTVAASP